MYDLIIIGLGPAGLAASIYASRYKIKHLVLGKLAGGLASEAFKIENYPGFVSISGMELMQKFQKQAQGLGAEIKTGEVADIRKTRKGFEIVTSQNKKYQTKAVILALGGKKRKLNIPGEEKFLGKGISYCATCDAAFFKDKTVAIVGGSDSAVSSSLLLAEHANKVYIIYRKGKLRAEPVWVERAQANPKIEIITNTNIIEVKGKDKVEKVILDKPYQRKSEIELDGLFIEAGTIPAVSLVRKLGIELDKENHIKINSSCATNVPGVYAAGDITTGSDKLKQIVTACAEGAIATTSVYKYLKGKS